jgi:hypothetical protein
MGHGPSQAATGSPSIDNLPEDWSRGLDGGEQYRRAAFE